MNDSLARWLRTILFMVAGGALTPLFDQIVRDVPEGWKPYTVLLGGFLVNAAVLISEELKGVGVMRTPTPPKAQPDAPIK